MEFDRLIDWKRIFALRYRAVVVYDFANIRYRISEYKKEIGRDRGIIQRNLRKALDVTEKPQEVDRLRLRDWTIRKIKEAKSCAIDQRNFKIFSSYRGRGSPSFDDLGKQFGLSRGTVQNIVARYEVRYSKFAASLEKRRVRSMPVCVSHTIYDETWTPEQQYAEFESLRDVAHDAPVS